MPGYKLTPEAEADLDRIFDFGIDAFGDGKCWGRWQHLKYP